MPQTVLLGDFFEFNWKGTSYIVDTEALLRSAAGNFNDQLLGWNAQIALPFPNEEVLSVTIREVSRPTVLSSHKIEILNDVSKAPFTVSDTWYLKIGAFALAQVKA